MEASQLIGPDGKPIKTNSIPVLKYKEFTFPMRLLSEADAVKPGKEGQIRPGDIIKEYRAAFTELSDRVNLLTAIICVLAKDGVPEVKSFLDSVGVNSLDLDNKVVYRANEA
jgi:hypothetical protein